MRLLAIDPGETVGWAIYEGNSKVDGGQTDWGVFRSDLADAFGVVSVLSDTTFGWAYRAAERSPFYGIEQIVIEDFVIYPPDVGDGPPPPWDQVITARLIGAIQFIADAAGVPVDYQGAKIKSDALRGAAAEDFARPLHDNRHENDATMHANYWLARRMVKNGEPS